MNLSPTAVVLALTLALPVGGCGFFTRGRHRHPKPVVEAKPLNPAPVAGPAATEPLLIDSVEKLPQGFYFQRRDRRMKLYVVPRLPTPDAPHVIIAGLSARPASGSAWSMKRADVHAALKAKARELGANAVFVPGSQSHLGYALHISSAAPAAADHPSHDALFKRVAGSLEGFRAQGAPVAQELSGGRSLSFDRKRGRCYAFAFALDQQAQLGADGQHHVVIATKTNDDLMSNHSHMAVEPIAKTDDGFDFKAPLHGPYLALREGVVHGGCAWSDGKVAVKLYTRGRRQDLGTGKVWVQVFSKKINAAELKKRKTEHDLAVAEARAAAERQRRIDAERRAEREAQRRRDAERRAASASSNRNSSSSSGTPSSYYSFSLHSDCSRTVTLYVTSSSGNPRYSSGTKTSLGGNNTRSFSGTGPTYFWILDSSGNGVSSFVAGAGQRDMKILSSCTGFGPR